MIQRKQLEPRRNCETFNFKWEDIERWYAVTVGFYPDNTIGEVFISLAKSGEALEAVARDGAVTISIALQYGATIETLTNALTRDDKNKPSSLIGAVLDEIKKRYYTHEVTHKTLSTDSVESS